MRTGAPLDVVWVQRYVGMSTKNLFPRRKREGRGEGGRIRHTLRLPSWKGSGLVCPPALPPALMGESGKKEEEEKEEEGRCKTGFDDAAPEVSESFLKRYAILLHCKGSGQGGRRGKSTKASGGGAIF